LARIKRLQDLLGGLNDARTAHTLLDRLEPGSAPVSPRSPSPTATAWSKARS
jgi:hypothetical protein